MASALSAITHMATFNVVEIGFLYCLENDWEQRITVGLWRCGPLPPAAFFLVWGQLAQEGYFLFCLKLTLSLPCRLQWGSSRWWPVPSERVTSDRWVRTQLRMNSKDCHGPDTKLSDDLSDRGGLCSLPGYKSALGNEQMTHGWSFTAL